MILILITLISLCTQAGRALRVKQPYRVVASDGEVRLRCSYSGRTEEMRVALYKGMYGEQQCRGELGHRSVDIVVSGLRGEDSDLYRCRMEVIYPPPYLVKYGNGTIFYIPEQAQHRDCPSPAGQKQEDPGSKQDILPIAVLVFFLLLIIIIIISTYKFVNMSHRRKMYAQMAPVVSKRVDCRFGYENFL
ncbi:hypothetical protein AAFF_G00213200 [Aldrovandia affinis]|uniref:Immunoglobulin V-set domain-containing protein n=1 Tax=Aldrovandia affinis TaxID=143900 RepID=A0AAD7W4I1_9TELE|nr:hypothetical protein AAFF_G00213200 [Aldrovandia affinis]